MHSISFLLENDNNYGIITQGMVSLRLLKYLGPPLDNLYLVSFDACAYCRLISLEASLCGIAS